MLKIKKKNRITNNHKKQKNHGMTRKGELGIMQSFREQNNYHGTPPTYPPEAHEPSRVEEFSPRQQSQIFQGSYGGRRGGTATPAVAPGENSNLQNYQTYRKESGDFYYLGNKEAGSPGGQTPQRRLPGPVQSYGSPQGNSSTSSTGFSSHYGRESHHSQFAGQHSSSPSLSQYSQDFPGSFSPGGGPYSSHVSSQLRHQLYQSHQPIPQPANPPASSTGTSHLQQIPRSANLNSPSGYSLRMGQFGQHYPSSPGSSSGSYPPQRFGQSGTNYEGYSPGGTSSPYESHMSGSSFGTQQGYSSYTSQHLKNFEAAKIPQGASQQQQQQQNPSNLMQYSNSSKLLSQNQTGQYNQSEVPVRSPMQFQQNFSPISNPSPAASVVQSPSCSSTPSPLMTSGENIQCAQGNVSLQSRNRILPMMPQLSPNTQITSFKGYGVESPHEKRLTDPGLSSLSALSSQVANLPNTVQHMLLSDALAPHKKGGKRTSRKTDSCANSETSSQAEEQLKSPLVESLDGSCSSSSVDPGERVRQLSGQSTSSEAGYKGPPSEKPSSPVHVWQNELSEKTPDIDTMPEPAETFQEITKPSEKSVGVIVSTETVANRSEKVVDEVSTLITNDDDPTPEPELPETAKGDDTKSYPNPQNGEPDTNDAASTTIGNVPLIETDKSPVGAGFGFNETPSNSRNTSSLLQQPKNVDTGTFGGHSERKTGRNEKYPSLLQEVLQGHHQQERRYVRNAQEQTPVTESPDVPLRPNVLMSQANDQTNRSMLGKTLAPHLESSHWVQWDRKPTSEIKQINLADFPNTRKFEGEAPASCHEPSGCASERRSVICDISPLRQLVRDPASAHHVSSQERSQDGRAGQSVILPSGILSLEKSNSQTGVPKGEDMESSKILRKRTGEQCIPYSSKESPRGNASPRSMTFDSNQEYSTHGRSSNSKRGTGRVGSRGRAPAQSQDLSDKLKLSPGRSRGSSEIHHITPAMSLSDRASREALYSAFFQNADNSPLGYHTNSRSSSYGEPHPSFTNPLHYKRQMYQQEEYKEWLGSSAQAILSASQHRQDLQRKSPRQESYVRSPGRSENEGLAYGQPGSFHEPSNIDFSRQIRMSEGTTSTLTVGDFKRNSQKAPPGDTTGWHLGRQSSPVKKAGSPASANQKPFSPIRDAETHGSRPSEPTELSKSGCNTHRPTVPEEVSHHNPLIMRRKVRSFISPIPSKRQLSDDKARPVIATSKEGSDRALSSHIRSLRANENEFLSLTEEQSKSAPEQKSPTAVTLSSPTKTKILPPRKGRGLKLEAIVQKITSPNVRRTAAPSSSESVVEPVTLDDILSLKGRGSEAGSSSMEETAERTVDAVTDISNNEDLKIQSLSPKSFEAWPVNDDKQIKKEIDEQFIETKDLPQTGPLIQQASKHYLETRVSSPALEQKCSLTLLQPCEMLDKEKVVNAPCPITPKQTILPAKGYFPSGKKKGRPIGSVNKQKKQQVQQQLQQQQQNILQQELDQTQLQSPIATDLAPLTPPQQTQAILDPGLESEPKPKRRRRERRKQPGTTRRRRSKQAAPIVAPVEPEIKLKYASQTLDKTETKTKSFFPYIHVQNKEELGLSCVIINAEEEEQRWRKVTSVRKDQRSTSPQPSESKALPVSSFMVQGPAVTESESVGHLVCCFCGKWANYKNLGDLFGPFYTPEYASTLSKNPPSKKLAETPQKVKVRHKDTLDGSKSDSDEEDEEPQQAREQRSLSAHPRYKRRNRSGDCTSSRHAVPSRRKTTDSCELVSLDSSGSVNADGVPDQGFQIPQLPLDSNEFWMHEACVLWANGVYFVCGRLYGLQEAFDIAREMICACCQAPGATLGCFNKGCVCCYHFPCAMDSECLLNEENFSVRCLKHKTKTIKGVLPDQPEQG